MAGKKRTRRANGDKDKNGKSRRRKNGTGTLEKRGDKWIALYYVYVDGLRKRKARTIDTDLVRDARERAGQSTDGITEPITAEDARIVLGYLSEDGGKITREMMLKRTQAELQSIQADRAEVEKAKAAEAAKLKADEDERRAIAVDGAFALYEQSKKRPDSGERTLDGYRSQYATFAKWVKDNHPDRPKLKDFTPDMAEEFIDHIETTRSRNTRNKYLVFLRTFWRVLRWNPDAQLAIDPWDGIKNLTQAPDEIKHKELTADELARIGKTIVSDALKPVLQFSLQPKDKRCKPVALDLRGEMLGLFAVGIYTGLRLGDCACLEWSGENSTIDLVRGIIDAVPRKTMRKYKRHVLIPIHPTLAALLLSVPDDQRRGYVLPTLADIYLNREPSMITNRIQEILRSSGIVTTTDAPEDGGGTKARVLAGFHSLRHTFASIMLNAGVQYALVEKMLGHSKQSMTAHYFHENAAALAAAVARLPQIPELIPDCDTAKATAQLPLVMADAQRPDDPSTGRLSAFRAAWDALTPEERKNARAYIERTTDEQADASKTVAVPEIAPTIRTVDPTGKNGYITNTIETGTNELV